MIVRGAAEFLAAYSVERYPVVAPTAARGAFLVSPRGFALAAESASDNRYMANAEPGANPVAPDAQRALAQHAALADALRESVPTVVFEGDPAAPDGVFPNNVFATAPDRAIVGAMRHAVRRREAARADIRAYFRDALGYQIVDLSTQPVVAELTGALVIDRGRGIGFCGLSERCDFAGACAMHEAFGLRLTYCFELAAGEYHANVVLAQLASRALIVAADGFADRADADAIAQVYAPQVLWLTPAQKAAFAGNAIALDTQRVWMSATAAAALTPQQRGLLGG